MAHSVIEAIKQGIWDYEPEDELEQVDSATKALPGTHEKLDVLARRVEEGMPLWHPSDRLSFDDEE